MQCHTSVIYEIPLITSAHEHISKAVSLCLCSLRFYIHNNLSRKVKNDKLIVLEFTVLLSQQPYRFGSFVFLRNINKKIF